MKNAKKVLIGSALLIGQSLSTKLIGLVSTLILARVLVPEDFGLVAIATLLFGFIEVLSNTGSMQYLISVEEIDKQKINTAWTLDFILKMPLAIVFALLAPFIASLYGDERLIAIIYTLSLLLFIKCLKTPAESILRRDQEFYSLVKLGVISKFISVVVAIILAISFKSYWALIIGHFIQGTISSLGSYLIHSFRPHFTLTNLKDQWAFSGWMLPQAVTGFFRTQLDTLIVSATFEKSVLGSYHIMKYLAYIPSAHIILPATQPLLVELRKTKYNSNDFTNQFNISFISTMIIALPMISLMIYHHTLITAVLLGDQWLEYSSLLAAFSSIILAMALFQQAQRVLIIFGKTKQIFYYELITFIGLYSALFFVGVDDIFIFSVYRVGIETLASLALFIYITLKYTSLSNLVHLGLILVPVIAASIIGLVASSYFQSISGYSLLNLISVTIIFYLGFSTTVFLAYCTGVLKTSEFIYLKTVLFKIVKPLNK